MANRVVSLVLHACRHNLDLVFFELFLPVGHELSPAQINPSLLGICDDLDNASQNVLLEHLDKNVLEFLKF